MLIESVLILDQTSPTPTIKLVVKKWETQWFDRHFYAYSVIPTQILVAIDVRELLDHHPSTQQSRIDRMTVYTFLCAIDFFRIS